MAPGAFGRPANSPYGDLPLAACDEQAAHDRGAFGPGFLIRLEPGPERRNLSAMAHRVEIVYCTKCRWLLRAAWMAQELLTTFEAEITELTLKPGVGGIFEVHADGALVWSRKEQGRFPDIVELKKVVRDRIAPEKDLGHGDRKPET